MKKEYIPYYLSRAILSIAFAFLVMGFTWKAALLAIILFGLFLLYLHSGWFQVDPSHPLIPLRRDERGRQVQRKALIAAVVAGSLAFILLGSPLGLFHPVRVAGSLALTIGIIAYFVVQFILFART
jgi:hypothetical protein